MVDERRVERRREAVGRSPRGAEWRAHRSSAADAAAPVESSTTVIMARAIRIRSLSNHLMLDDNRVVDRMQDHWRERHGEAGSTDEVEGEVDAARRDVSTHIGFLLNRAHRRSRQAVVDALAGSGLNPGHVAILGAVSATSGLSQAELGDITGIEKSSMVLLVDALETGGWIRRGPHRNDRRAHALVLTSEGRRRLRTLGPRLQAAEDALLERLTVAERRRLVALLHRFTNDEDT